MISSNRTAALLLDPRSGNLDPVARSADVHFDHVGNAPRARDALPAPSSGTAKPQSQIDHRRKAHSLSILHAP
jgi:hypothetical protein